jgi:hypothetical protein
MKAKLEMLMMRNILPSSFAFQFITGNSTDSTGTYVPAILIVRRVSLTSNDSCTEIPSNKEPGSPV